VTIVITVAPGFLRNLFRGGSGAQAEAPTLAQQRISRRSTGFQEFIRSIARTDGQRVLDLGPTSPANIGFITGLGHRAYNDDLLLSSHDPALLTVDKEGVKHIDVERFLAENLAHEREIFDAVLLWDVPDYLDETLVKPVVERIHKVTKPGGLLLGFFHTRDAGPDAPYYRYHIADKDTLELQRGPQFALKRVFNNRHIENLFHDFHSLKFFLGRDNIREVLVVR
jgi:SAM-dependent methyltransferase